MGKKGGGTWDERIDKSECVRRSRIAWRARRTVWEIEGKGGGLDSLDE